MLEALLGELDAIVWLVDGLQPLTAVERDAFDDAVAHGVAVHVLVSRFDLLGPEDRRGVLRRVRALSAPRNPLTLLPVDPRDPDGGVLDALSVVEPSRSPRRRARLRVALEQVHAALGHLPAPPSPGAELERVLEAWRELARQALDATRQQVRDGELLFRDQAREALVERLQRAHLDLAAQERSRLGAAPSWRASDVEELDLWEQAADVMSGTAGVLKALDEAAVAEVAVVEQAWRNLLDGDLGRWMIEQVDARSRALETVRAALDLVGTAHNSEDVR